MLGRDEWMGVAISSSEEREESGESGGEPADMVAEVMVHFTIHFTLNVARGLLASVVRWDRERNY